MQLRAQAALEQSIETQDGVDRQARRRNKGGRMGREQRGR
jgi:hypothetical protein